MMLDQAVSPHEAATVTPIQDDDVVDHDDQDMYAQDPQIISSGDVLGFKHSCSITMNGDTHFFTAQFTTRALNGENLEDLTNRLTYVVSEVLVAGIDNAASLYNTDDQEKPE